MKFSALRTLATLLRVIAVVEGLLGIYMAGVAASDPKGGSMLVFAVAVAAVALRVVVTLAFAEAIGVFLAIEESARRTAEATAKNAAAAAPSDEGDGPASKAFITCKSCGQKTEADGRFCQKCGKLV